MNITLIGASGFVGSRLMALLNSSPHNYTLRNLDKQPSEFFPQFTRFCDVRDYFRLKREIGDADVVILLAAEHRDDVTPSKLYYDVNVAGMRNVLRAMEYNDIKRIIFTSSVAVYGLNRSNPNEEHCAAPCNDYGKSKWQAEQVLQEWHKSHPDWNINIIRPAVIFGERNRGNVYNLLKHISQGRFLKVGSCENKKSMAYVGNVSAFIRHLIDNSTNGYNVFNYTDKPDLTMNELLHSTSKILGRSIPAIRLPYWIGLCGGKCFDALAWITSRKLPISSVRVEKFCATTQFDATKAHTCGFKAPYTLLEGLSKTLSYEFATPPASTISLKRER